MTQLGPSKAERLFAEFLRGSGYKASTVRTKRAFFAMFLRTLPPTSDLRDMDAKTLACWLQDFVESGASPATARALAGTFRLFFRMLYIHGMTMTNPARELSVRIVKKDRVRMILTMEEVSWFLDSIDPSTRRGLRDRALFELLYSSGLRAGEASALSVKTSTSAASRFVRRRTIETDSFP